MAKVVTLINGITIKGNKFDMDSVVFDPPVRIKSNTPFEVEDGTTITLSSTHCYMGITTLNCTAVMIAKDGVPVIRVATPSGSFVEGELELVDKKGSVIVTTIGKVKELKSRKFERRIIK